MTAWRLWFRIAWRNARRRPLRSIASIFGVALAIFLFSSIESFARGFQRALASDATSRMLVVYRANRYCPQTSRLPEPYRATIEAIPGVESAIPMRVYMNNCRANLDLLLFQGIPPDAARQLESGGDIALVEGSVASFIADPGAALVGEALASRRGVHVGSAFRFGLVDVKIAGIFRARDRVQDSVVYVHLPYLQRTLDSGETGIVTQFDVRIEEGADGDAIAREIDSRLASREVPTQTFLRSEFLKRETKELAGLIEFARAFGKICVLVLCVLLLNASLLSAEERHREHAVFFSIGYEQRDVFMMLLLESSGLTLAGAWLGSSASFLLANIVRLTVGIEGIPIALDPSPLGFIAPVGVTMLAALLASAVPALLATRVNVASSLKA